MVTVQLPHGHCTAATGQAVLSLQQLVGSPSQYRLIPVFIFPSVPLTLPLPHLQQCKTACARAM